MDHETFQPSLGAVLLGIRLLQFHAPVVLITAIGLERQARTDNEVINTVDNSSGAVVSSATYNMHYVSDRIQVGIGVEVPLSAGTHVSIVPQYVLWDEIGPYDNCCGGRHASLTLSARWRF